MKLYLLTTLLLFSGHLFAGTVVSVGPGTACDYDTSSGFDLQNALIDLNSEIRLVNSIIHIGPFDANGPVIIRGGFNSCTDANNNQQNDILSVVDGDAMDSTLSLNSSGSYYLEKIKLTNGSNTSGEGGGLLLSGIDMVVVLDQVVVEENTAKQGGGIAKLELTQAHLTIKDTIIAGNTGINQGGGIYFKGMGQLTIYGNSAVTNNATDGYGGGLYLVDTEAILVGGSNLNLNAGVTFNSAKQDGGGLHIQNSNVQITGGLYPLNGVGVVGDSSQNFNILFNQSDSDQNGTGSGAAMAVKANTQLDMAAVTLAFNQSHASAGALYVQNGSSVSMRRNLDSGHNTECGANLSIGCNIIVGNTAEDVGGGVYITTGSSAVFEAVNFANNRANNSTAGFISGAQTTVTISSSIFTENGENGQAPFNDLYVLRTNDQAVLTINQSTAVANNATGALIYNNNANLNSYYNYFYNEQTGLWLSNNGSPTNNYQCMVVDESNNIEDLVNNLFVTSNLTHQGLFVDLPNRDLHLKDDSILINFQSNMGCAPNPLAQLYPNDADGQTRTNGSDLGADESLVDDIIFTDQFEQ